MSNESLPQITVADVESFLDGRADKGRPGGILLDAQEAGLDVQGFREAVEDAESDWVTSPTEVEMIALGVLLERARERHQTISDLDAEYAG